jgi:hypothetical protein
LCQSLSQSQSQQHFEGSGPSMLARFEMAEAQQRKGMESHWQRTQVRLHTEGVHRHQHPERFQRSKRHPMHENHPVLFHCR